MAETFNGLSTGEAQKMQEKFGFNSIESKSTSALLKFLKRFVNPITLMIELALVLSFIAGKTEDFYIILALLIVNVGIESWQEHKAQTALSALQKTLAPVATVLRDGAYAEIPAKELVVGDIVKISIGDIVPADVEVLEEELVQVDQATITGESLPVERSRGDTLYSSSVVQKGSFVARVVTIGSDTFIGKSATLVNKAETEEESHFQKAILGIGKFLAILAVILISIVFVVMLWQGDSLLEVINFSLVLAIASIPVALPAVLSVTMAIGASALSKHKAIVTNFKAVEELAGVDTLCVDKTGTLTKNEITINEPKAYGKFDMQTLFIFALLTSERVHKNTIELAIQSYAKTLSINEDLVIDKYTIKEFIAFTPTTKTTAAILEVGGGATVEIVMGAPQIIAKQLTDTKERNDLLYDVDKLAEDGFRALAIIKKEGGQAHLVGLMPMFDPPRDDSKTVMQKVKKYGLNIKMITGDNTAIARFVAKALSMGSRLVSTKELNTSKDTLSLIHKTDIFTEVVPEDKYNIVAALQKEGHIVAMTGDGVNDAPALKKADIGIAVAGASPAARAAADVVLLNPGLSTIEVAIEHSRMIFARMQAYATFRIAETMRIIFFITFSILLFGFTPIPAIMIILLALLNDIPVMAMAYDNAPIAPKPTRWDLRETIIIASVLGALGLVSSFLLLYFLYGSAVPLAIIYTIIFLKLDISGHSTLYTTRTGEHHFWNKPFPSWRFMVPAMGSRIIGSVFAYFGIFMAPISFTAVVAIWVYGTLWFFFNDWVKVRVWKLINRKKKDFVLSSVHML